MFPYDSEPTAAGGGALVRGHARYVRDGVGKLVIIRIVRRGSRRGGGGDSRVRLPREAHLGAQSGLDMNCCGGAGVGEVRGRIRGEGVHLSIAVWLLL